MMKVNRIEELKHVFGSHLAPSELTFLENVKDVFKRVTETNSGFQLAVVQLELNLTKIVRSKFSVSSRINVDMHQFVATISSKKATSKRFTDKLVVAEKKFCNDLIGAIDFVIRNGIGFGLIINVLCHDINEINKEGSLTKAQARGFDPKVEGWASYDPQSICDPLEVGA